LLRRRGGPASSASRGGRAGPSGGRSRVNGRALAAWVTGFLLYQWSVPTPLARWQDWMDTLFHRWLHLPFPLWISAAGASLPAFSAALVVYVALVLLASAVTRSRLAGRVEGRPPPA